MPSLRGNLLANFVGAGWAALMQLATVPLLVKYLGVEAYGLIGFYAMLLSALQIFDFGISPTLNRELARMSARSAEAGEIRDLVRTLETTYIGMGVAMGAALLLLANLVATRWINAANPQSPEVVHSIRLMAVLIALQWPLSFYRGGLMGLQRQVLQNAVRIGAASLAWLGAVAVAKFVSRSVSAYFYWQCAVGALQLLVTASLLWKSLPGAARSARFTAERLRSVMPFAAGMGGISVIGVILTQMDKLVLSRILTLQEFGYYALAGMAAASMQLVITPIYSAVFPRMSHLAATGNEETLRVLYHEATQFMAILVLPVIAVTTLFGADIFHLWTGDRELGRIIYPVAVLLVAGGSVNGLMQIPYGLQLAYGWTSIGLRIAAVQLLFLFPALLVVAPRYGAVGAAAVWLALNVTYLMAGVPLTHRRVLRGEGRRWILQDVGAPLLASVLVAGVMEQAFKVRTGSGMVVLGCVCTFLAVLLAAALAAPAMRRRLSNAILT